MKIKVHSGDPVKKYVVALIKKKTNCSKVTSVIRVEGSTFKNNDGFYGQAHRKILNSKSYLGMGTCFVSEQELHEEYPDVFFAPNNCGPSPPPGTGQPRNTGLLWGERV
jgi:hypothetical protein